MMKKIVLKRKLIRKPSSRILVKPISHTFYRRPAITLGPNQILSEELFQELWPVVLKVWDNRCHCMAKGCSRLTFVEHMADEDSAWRRLSPGLGRAILLEGVKRGWLEKGTGLYGHSTFQLLSRG